MSDGSIAPLGGSTKGEEGMPQGLKPHSLLAFSAWAEAQTYLRSKSNNRRFIRHTYCFDWSSSHWCRLGCWVDWRWMQSLMLSMALDRVRSEASTLWVAKKLMTSSRCLVVQKKPVALTTRTPELVVNWAWTLSQFCWM